MAKNTVSLGDLGRLIDNSTSVDEQVLKTLSNKSQPAAARKKAREHLCKCIDLIIRQLDDEKEFLARNIERYKGYCRNLAAYLLVCSEDEDKKQMSEEEKKVFLLLLDLMQVVALTYKHDLRALKKQCKEERAYVSQLGYNWEVLSSPFVVDRFANMLLGTEISVKEAPTVVYVDRETVIVKEVEKTVVVEKEVEVEVEPYEEVDPDDFGKEGQYTEFKSSIINSCNAQPQIWNICKSVCAFLNADGGVLYIGVDDNGRAIPSTMNGFPAGIHEDIAYLSRAQRMPYGKTTVDSYCLYVKHAIITKFRDGNDVSKFDGNIIVSETKHDNVIQVVVRQSKYCVVKLDGVAFQRTGASSREMDEGQIERRMYELYSVPIEVHYRSVLNKAINEKRQVVLHGYVSGNSATISDRYVEPMNFVCDGNSILCYDTVKLATRQFKLSRIGDVRILSTPWQYEDLHHRYQVDIFGWTNDGEWLPICLDMKLPAMTFMIESLPNAKKDSFSSLGNGWYRLETSVHSLTPVIGFFLSYAENIEIRETSCSDKLKKQIKEYVTEHVMPKL